MLDSTGAPRRRGPRRGRARAARRPPAADHPRILFTPHSAFYSVEGSSSCGPRRPKSRIPAGRTTAEPCQLGTPPHRNLSVPRHGPRSSRFVPHTRLMTPNHRVVSWMLVASLTAALTAVTTVQASAAVPRAPHRVVLGPRLLQPVVLVVDPVGWAALGAPARFLCGGGAVGLEDELPGADPAGAGAVLQDPSRSAHPARDPEHHVLVDHPGCLYAGAIGVEIRDDCGLGGGPGAFCALALASGLERFSRTPTGLAVRALGRSRNSRPAGGVGRRGRSGDARLPPGICGDGRHASHSCRRASRRI